MITICMTYYRSLTLANFEAALYSVRRQDLSRVAKIIIVDNDTSDSKQSIQDVIDAMQFPVLVRLVSCKHCDPSRTHSWSTNLAVREARTPWVLFTRADYIIDFELLSRFTDVVESNLDPWNGFVTARVRHLHVDVAECNKTAWRGWPRVVLQNLPGVEENYMKIDTGVWMARRDAFERVGGLNENLTAWGHAQTHFQYKMHEAGTEFVCIEEPLFYHPQHGGEKDLRLAHQQLRDHGIDLKTLWARYQGVQPY